MGFDLAKLKKFVSELKAAGETTRLRLLVLLSLGELSVKDLTKILDQSQPRISRHLKILADAKLIIGHQEGAWVYYGLNSGTEQAQFVYSLISRLDVFDEQLLADKERLKELQANKRVYADRYFAKIAKDWDIIRSMHISETEIENAIISLIAKDKYDLLLDLGTGTGRMLELLANNYQRAIGIDSSNEMISIARAKLASSNISNAQVRLQNIEQLDEYDNRADMVILHQVLHYFDDPMKIIYHAKNLITYKGKTLIVDFAPHDFEILRSDHAHLRMGISNNQMQIWAKASGLAVSDYVEIANNKQEDGLSVCIWVLEHDK